jgi:putative tryptophan/tyrosine transport system substrate-binding protein
LTQRDRLVALAAEHAISTMCAYREFVTAGGLMNYCGNLRDVYRLIGLYTGQILRGEETTDLPVEQITKVELVVNRKTANALGMKVPLPTLIRLDI